MEKDWTAAACPFIQLPCFYFVSAELKNLPLKRHILPNPLGTLILRQENTDIKEGLSTADYQTYMEQKLSKNSA